MAPSHMLSGLIARRAELAGELRELEGRGDRLRADIAALNEAIRVFAPGYPAESIPPERPRTGRERFGHAELTKLVLDVLRTAAEPMSGPAIAREVMRRKRLPEDGRTRRIVAERVDRTLTRQVRLLERVTVGSGARWRVKGVIPSRRDDEVANLLHWIARFPACRRQRPRKKEHDHARARK